MKVGGNIFEVIREVQPKKEQVKFDINSVEYTVNIDTAFGLRQRDKTIEAIVRVGDQFPISLQTTFLILFAFTDIDWSDSMEDNVDLLAYFVDNGIFEAIVEKISPKAAEEIIEFVNSIGAEYASLMELEDEVNERETGIEEQERL